MFQVLIGRGAGIENFAIHLFAGMVVVHFFTETFNGGTKSLVSNRGLIVKLPMPRELFPVATMLVALWHTGPMLVILDHRQPRCWAGPPTRWGCSPGCWGS